MKTNDPDQRRSTDQLLQHTVDCEGPTLESVIAVLRGERRRKTKRTLMLCGLAGALLFAAVFQRELNSGSASLEPVLPTVPSADIAGIETSNSEVEVEKLTDDQLLAAISSLPAALVRSSDGTTRLLVIKPN